MNLAELIPWADVGLTGLLAGGVFMVFTGRLVPRSTVEQMRQERDARLADMAAAHKAEVEARQVTAEQMDELVKNSRTTMDVLQALRDTTSRGPQ